MQWVADHVARVREAIAVTCQRAERDPHAITLVGVIKGIPPALVRAAVDAGIRHVGESRIQDARPQRAILADPSAVTWHCIGHLQTNKVKPAVELFHTIHSVDSARLLDAIEERCVPLRTTRDVFLEVNVTGEATKHGVRPEDLGDLAAHTSRCPHVRWRGLMAIGPFMDDARSIRAAFRRLRAMRDRLSHTTGRSDLKLSMGMSRDFQIALEEGADMVRIGSAIFQERFWDDQR